MAKAEDEEDPSGVLGSTHSVSIMAWVAFRALFSRSAWAIMIAIAPTRTKFSCRNAETPSRWLSGLVCKSLFRSSRRLEIRARVWSCGWLTPHVWLGSTRPRSQCVGGMLLVQWCYELS